MKDIELLKKDSDISDNVPALIHQLGVGITCALRWGVGCVQPNMEYGSSFFGYIWYNIIIAPNNGSSVVVRLLMLVVVVVCYRRMVSREIPSLN